MVEIADWLNVVNGTIELPAALVLVEMTAPVADGPAELVPKMVTPLVGALEIPRTILGPLLAAVVPLELGAIVLAVVGSLVFESSVSVSELVLVMPGSAAMVDP